MKKRLIIASAILVSSLWFFPDILIERAIGGIILFLLLFKISYIDYKTYIIPNKLLIPLIITGAFHQLTQNTYSSLLNIFFAIIFVSIIFLPIYFLTDSMGGGDVKLSYCLAVWLAYPTISAAITIAVLSGSIISIYLIIKGKCTHNTPIPFAPFLSLGGLTAFLFSENIIIAFEKWGIL